MTETQLNVFTAWQTQLQIGFLTVLKCSHIISDVHIRQSHTLTVIVLVQVLGRVFALVAAILGGKLLF